MSFFDYLNSKAESRLIPQKSEAVTEALTLKDPTYKTLPPVFRIDDDQECRGEGKLYCKISLTLQPSDMKNNSAHWLLIKDTIEHPKFYNHDELFHAICVNKLCPKAILEDENLDIKTKLSKCYETEYSNLGLNFVISEFNCNSEDRYSVKVIDIIVLVTCVIYLTLITLATYLDYRRNVAKYQESGQLQKEHKMVPVFSLLANWKKLCSLNDRPDFQKLKFIQGIRFYNMLLVIFCHTICSYSGGYMLNTEYFELVYRSRLRLFFATLVLFLVQTFFLISAFLLSYHVCQSMEVYRESKWRYTVITFLNRYLRILPPVFVMIMLANTQWIISVFQGPVKDLYSGMEYQRCQKYWWTNLIFINNHYKENEMCYFLTWYLAADTQLYLVSLIILLIIWKFCQHTKTVLAVAFSVGIMIPTFICYKYGFDIIYRLTPENTKINNFRSFKFSTIYTSTFTNMASYMAGLGLGCFYYHLEKNNVYTKYHQVMWMSLFGFLPFAAVYIASHDYSTSVNILLSGIIKPCYALGVGAGILAMSQQKNGIIKKICELRPVLFLGNFTYSTYVVQYGIIFYRTAAAKEPMFVSDYIVMTSFIQDAVLCIFCGFIMHILVEMPSLQLQKMYVPQIRNIAMTNGCAKSK